MVGGKNYRRGSQSTTFFSRALNTKLIRITLKLPIPVVPPFFPEILVNETSHSLVR